MTNLINCGTCGYPLAPEERTTLVEKDGVMVKPASEYCKAIESALTRLQKRYADLEAKCQAREWVGLTQQDINIAFDDTQEGGGFEDFARAIEAKLREKNA